MRNKTDKPIFGFQRLFCLFLLLTFDVTGICAILITFLSGPPSEKFPGPPSRKFCVPTYGSY